MKFCDSRAMPISVPSTVASTMPVTASRSVFEQPLDEGVADRLGLAEVAAGIGKPGRLVEVVEARSGCSARSLLSW